MRSSDLTRSTLVLTLLGGLLGGCSTVDMLRPTQTQPDAALKTAASGNSASASSPAKASTTSATSATTSAKGKATDARNGSATGATSAAKADMDSGAASTRPGNTTVTRAVQQAFDDACKALRAGRIEEAERGFRALAQSHPELGGPHANLGLIHLRAERFNEAVTELELAVKASPEQPRYLNQLGIAYRQQGQFAKARAAYEQALDLDPTYAAATMNLAILNDLYLRNTPRALELYDQYLALSPAGDPAVSKWVIDLKNRQQRVGMLNIKETP